MESIGKYWKVLYSILFLMTYNTFLYFPIKHDIDFMTGAGVNSGFLFF